MSTSYERLLVPVDGSPGDERVMSLVSELVHQHQVSITLIYVVEVQQAMPLDAELPDEIDRGEAILHRAEKLALSRPHHKLTSVTTDLLQARSAGAAIVDEAIERRADAIVLAATNRTVFGKVTMGETIGYILKNAPCEVIVIRLASPSTPSKGG
jgi:nucleotide-binding universal stress UspA family protein